MIWSLDTSLSPLSVTLLQPHQHVVDGERHCPSPFRDWGTAGWQSSGTENSLPSISPQPFPMAATAEGRAGTRAQPLSLGWDSSEGHPVFRTPPGLSGGTCWDCILVHLLPSLASFHSSPSYSWSQECTLINISRANRHLRNCFLGNPTWEQSSLLFLQHLKYPFTQGFCNCCSFCL